MTCPRVGRASMRVRFDWCSALKLNPWLAVAVPSALVWRTPSVSTSGASWRVEEVLEGARAEGGLDVEALEAGGHRPLRPRGDLDAVVGVREVVEEVAALLGVRLAEQVQQGDGLVGLPDQAGDALVGRVVPVERRQQRARVDVTHCPAPR
jgi:hypothetical protein